MTKTFKEMGKIKEISIESIKETLNLLNHNGSLDGRE